MKNIKYAKLVNEQDDVQVTAVERDELGQYYKEWQGCWPFKLGHQGKIPNEVTVFEVGTEWVEGVNYVKLWGQAFSRQKVEQAGKN